jgi:ubiquinone biosynthesis accessory factor UbiJ
MINALHALLVPALMERLVLLVNHVVSGEPVAVQRLRPHAGRSLRIELDGWPRALPAPPTLVFRITPAGLVEWCADATDPADLRLLLDASNPAALALQALAGQQPAMTIDGDAQFAADVDWLTKNLRWEPAADLEPIVGPALAHEITRFGSMLVRGLRQAVQGAGAAASGAEAMFRGAGDFAQRMRTR